MENDIKLIADKRGAEMCCVQAMEECSELIKALTKKMRYAMGDKTLRNISDYKSALNGMYEELADVGICMDQLMYLFTCSDEVARIRKEKIERTKEMLGLTDKEVG